MPTWQLLKYFLRNLKGIARAVLNEVRQIRKRTWVLEDMRRFKIMQRDSRPAWQWGPDYFCLNDKTVNTGFDRHYIYHPPWAVRKIIRDIKPSKHIDISSILHFSANLSAFLPVEFYDFRPADLKLDSLTCGTADLTALPFASNSVESISCMHTIEHIGLGRYGDTLDAEGDIKALRELERVVHPGGSLLLVTPVGEKSRVQFNAHRIYQPEWLVAQLPGMALKEFYFIPGRVGVPVILEAHSRCIPGEQYGCGCFWFVKKE